MSLAQPTWPSQPVAILDCVAASFRRLREPFNTALRHVDGQSSSANPRG